MTFPDENVSAEIVVQVLIVKTINKLSLIVDRLASFASRLPDGPPERFYGNLCSIVNADIIKKD